MSTAGIRILTAVLLMVAVSLVANEIAAQPLDSASGNTLDQSDPQPVLVVNGEKPWTSKVFDVQCVKPGDSGEATIKLENTGDEGDVTLHLLNLVDNDVVTTEPELAAGNAVLSQYVDMLIWLDDGDNLFEPGEIKIAEDTLQNIACIIYQLGPLPPGAIMYVGMAWSVDKGVGNEIHSDRCTFDIQFAFP